MKVNREIFRQYDIRGIYEDDLKGDFPYYLGRGLGSYLRQQNKKTISVGGDNRLTTPEIKEKLIKGLLSTGCEVFDIGIVPTPVLYFSVHYYCFDSGIMVTASHNPPQYNGFKIVIGNRSIYGKEIQEIADIIEREDFKNDKGKVSKEIADVDYINYIKSKFNFKNKFRVGVDTGNGIAGPIIVPLFKELGIKIFPLYIESDGNFPHHLPDPVVPENLKDLIKIVKEYSLDVGFGFDGDGDRLGVVDDTGEIQWGDRLLILYSREILKKMPKSKIIFDVKCTKALQEEIEKAGGIPIMWKTGHSLIEDKLHQENSPLAGELSGHLYFADEYYGYDDAIYASLRLLKILDNEGKKPSQLFSDVKKYFSTPEIRIEVPDEKKFDIVEKLKNYYKGKYPSSEIDGIKVYFPDGWALVRASNTQPALVIRIESESQEALNKIKNEFLEVIEKFK